jgi:hypothetical protein
VRDICAELEVEIIKEKLAKIMFTYLYRVYHMFPPVISCLESKARALKSCCRNITLSSESVGVGTYELALFSFPVMAISGMK